MTGKPVMIDRHPLPPWNLDGETLHFDALTGQHHRHHYQRMHPYSHVRSTIIASIHILHVIKQLNNQTIYIECHGKNLDIKFTDGLFCSNARAPCVCAKPIQKHLSVVS